jgi:hypothetical protein
LTLTLDGTGVTDYIVFSAGSNVSKRVQEFLKMTTTMDGDQHKPNDLVLALGRSRVRMCAEQSGYQVHPV